MEQLISKYGTKRKEWPKQLVKTLNTRNQALITAICERVCFVPKDLYFALGKKAKELLTAKQGRDGARLCKVLAWLWLPIKKLPVNVFLVYHTIT